MAPKVSLVVPCYNVEAYVERSLESALGQSLPDIELVCVNDGSTDATAALLRSLAARDSRVRVIDKQNTGYGHSVNTGFDAAHGDYLGILEPDDFMDPHMLERLHAAAVDHDADLVKCNYYYYRAQPVERWVFCNQLGEDLCGRVFCPLDEPRVFFAQPAIWAALYRADFLRGNDIRLNETPGASFQDTSFNFEVLMHARRAYFVFDALMNYRRDNESSSVWGSSKAFAICGEYERIEAAMDSFEDQDALAAVRRIMPARKFSTYYWNYHRVEPDAGLQFLYRVQQEYRACEQAGCLDWSAFPSDRPELAPALAAIMEDPLLYHLSETSPAGESLAAGLARYARAGGPRYVLARLRAAWGR